jgi:hypothetical protein
VVREALVKVTGLPYAWARTGVEVRTDQTGWATMTIVPTQNMPLGRRNALVMFVQPASRASLCSPAARPAGSCRP